MPEEEATGQPSRALTGNVESVGEAQPPGQRAQPTAEALSNEPASATADDGADAPGAGPQAATWAASLQPASHATAAEPLSVGPHSPEPQAAQLAPQSQSSAPEQGTAGIHAPQPCSREAQAAAAGAADVAAEAPGPEPSSSEARMAAEPLTAPPASAAVAAAAAADQPWPLGYYYQDAWGCTQVWFPGSGPRFGCLVVESWDPGCLC